MGNSCARPAAAKQDVVVVGTAVEKAVRRETELFRVTPSLTLHASAGDDASQKLYVVRHGEGRCVALTSIPAAVECMLAEMRRLLRDDDDTSRTFMVLHPSGLHLAEVRVDAADFFLEAARGRLTSLLASVA